MTDPIQLGTGILTWGGEERRTDRYGAVFLMEDGNSSRKRGGYLDQLDALGMTLADGVYGSLIATVLDPRRSTHIGDPFRGFRPSVPEKGEAIVLGTGRAFIEGGPYGRRIGLNPEDGRETDWLDPAALYRAHEQLVRLTFEPDDGAVPPVESAFFDPERSPL
jgi:hypothetical protein